MAKPTRDGAFRVGFRLRCSKIEEDTERFWTLLAEALGRSDTCRELVASAREWGLTEREVVERAVEQLDAPTMIVADDYQLATSPRLDLALVELLELSDNLFLSVPSRRTDCLDGPLFASLIPTTYIGVEQLAFTSDEVREFAALHGVDPDSVPGSITKLTGGWASALSALIRGLQEADSPDPSCKPCRAALCASNLTWSPNLKPGTSSHTSTSAS